jgi:hypothetical protein
MNISTILFKPTILAVAVAGLGNAGAARANNELVGWAMLPANTFAVGPTSGQFVSGPAPGAQTPPYFAAQPVQGFSAVLNGPTAGTYYVMPDNGFGSQGNSADTLLRVYAMQPDFKTYNGTSVVGTGFVNPVSYLTGVPQPSYLPTTFITLSDPAGKLGFPIQASYANYYNNVANPAVDPSIKSGRLLTGADFDIESMRVDKNGNLWFGEEFGPFLVKTDSTGKVLQKEIPLPNIVPPGSTSTGTEVRAPQNPYGGPSNLATSRGFEGMAINSAGDKLYTLLEGTVAGDNAINGTTNKNLRINEFDIDTMQYTNKEFLYQLDARGTNIGDMTAVNDHQFLVLERNGNTDTNQPPAPFKMVYLIDTNNVDASGFVQKTAMVDLMNVADPHDLNGDGSTTFTFPYVTIEDILVVDPTTLLIINDNNYPFGGGRSVNADNSEFLMIRLDQPLATVPVPAALPLMASGLAVLLGASRRRKAG